MLYANHIGTEKNSIYIILLLGLTIWYKVVDFKIFKHVVVVFDVVNIVIPSNKIYIICLLQGLVIMNR